MIVRFLAVAGVGGPIRPGKTWFYGGYRLNHQEELTIGHADPATTQLDNWTAKVTHQLTGSSQLVASSTGARSCRPSAGSAPDRPLEAAWFQRSVNVPMKADYRNAVGNRMFVNAQAAHWSNRFPLYPTQTRSSSVEGSPRGGSRSTRGTTRTPTTTTSSGRSPSRRRAAASRRHTLKVGVEAYRERLGAVARRALSEWGSGCSVVLTFERCGAYAGRPGRGRHGTGWAESYDSVLQLVTS